MNGTITVESEYEKGSTFCIQLPQKIVNTSPSIPSPENTVKVTLIIENEYVYSQICKDLSRFGIEYINLECQESLEKIKDGYIIVEKSIFSDMIKKAIMDNPKLNDFF